MTDRQIPEEKRETPSEPVPGTTGQTVRSASREPVFGDNARKRTGEGDSADGQNGGASGQTVREKRTPKSGSTERRVDLVCGGDRRGTVRRRRREGEKSRRSAGGGGQTEAEKKKRKRRARSR